MGPVSRRLIGTTDPSHGPHSPPCSRSHVDLVQLTGHGPRKACFSTTGHPRYLQSNYLTKYAGNLCSLCYMLQGWHRPALLIAVCALGCVSVNIWRIPAACEDCEKHSHGCDAVKQCRQPAPFHLYSWLRLGGGNDTAIGLANKAYKNSISPRYQVLIHHSLTAQFDHSEFIHSSHHSVNTPSSFFPNLSSANHFTATLSTSWFSSIIQNVLLHLQHRSCCLSGSHSGFSTAFHDFPRSGLRYCSYRHRICSAPVCTFGHDCRAVSPGLRVQQLMPELCFRPGSQCQHSRVQAVLCPCFSGSFSRYQRCRL